MPTISAFTGCQIMQPSAKNYSISDASTVNLPNFDDWIISLQKISKTYRKYGSFLPTQIELLKNVHDGLLSSNSRVLEFAAPPASGKTHVIALCASYFEAQGIASCVVAPNRELASDFVRESHNIESRLIPEVLTIGNYVRKIKQFGFALIDEAHNLRSGLELCPEIVKTIHIARESSLYKILLHRIEQTGLIAKELNTESAHDTLTTLRKYGDFSGLAKILGTLTEWRTFLFQTEQGLDIKFLSTNPQRRDLIPKKRLLLFSATPLDEKELQFYCNINPASTRVFSKITHSNEHMTNVDYLFVDCATELEKTRLVSSALTGLKITTLLLLNNNKECLKWSRVLSHQHERRVITIRSHVSYSTRVQQYQKFAGSKNGILVTSSSVFWEGINISGLRIVIIPNPPYPQPTLLEVASGVHPPYEAVVRRRLTQGAGRVGREPNLPCVSVLLFKPRGMAFDGVTGEAMTQALQNLLPSAKEIVKYVR